MVSPPTRGWTHPQSVRERSLIGFPAHAGMDHLVGAAPRLVVRFPRPRGDGPELGFLAPFFDAVSPPTRGWTPRDDHADLAGRGFPAHAGMDPHHHDRSSLSSRFPRPRGDGPKITSGASPAPTVSPPTRGWTPAHQRPRQVGTGFPAHAGDGPFLEAFV